LRQLLGCGNDPDACCDQNYLYRARARIRTTMEAWDETCDGNVNEAGRGKGERVG
jgi:hypothetical protein